MAHPVRPDSYLEISNFYTVTIYEKGAEVVRMMQTLVGREGFRRGMDLYFQRHDGQAVTCDDFAQAIADANPARCRHCSAVQALVRAGRHARRLRRRARTTPSARSYDADAAQRHRATPGQAAKEPFVIPLPSALSRRRAARCACGELDGRSRRRAMHARCRS